VVDRASSRGTWGFHDLRRANATGLVSSGVDIRTAQSRLGHADVRMTLEIYARATNEADRAAAEAIGGCSTRSASSTRTSRTWRGMGAGSRRTAGSRGIAAG
jgi:Phage integrase family